MQINVKLEPRFVNKNSRGEFRSQLGVYWAIRSEFTPTSCYVAEHALMPNDLTNCNTVRAYSLEKRRKKVEVLDKPVKWTKKELRQAGLPIDEVRYHKRKVVTPAHWVGVYYDIPVALLEAAKLKVVQGNRTFKLVKID